MKNYFTFGNIDSRDYGVYIASSNLFDAASEDVEIITIPGRNGSIYSNNHRFKSFKAKVNCYVESDMQSRVDQFRNALMSMRKTAEYREAERPGEYRVARFLSAFSLAKSDKVGASFTLEFDCRPERFQETAEVVLNTSGDITNETLFDAKPVIKLAFSSLVGTGSFTIGRKVDSLVLDQWKIEASGIRGDLYVDCETMDFTMADGEINANSLVTVSTLIDSGELDMEFPYFPANSTISISDLTGISSITIEPRWWTV